MRCVLCPPYWGDGVYWRPGAPPISVLERTAHKSAHNDVDGEGVTELSRT